jgi:hypothetical protein
MNSRLALKLAASICVGVIGLGLVLAGSPRDTRVARNTAHYQVPKLTYELPLATIPLEPSVAVAPPVAYFISRGETNPLLKLMLPSVPAQHGFFRSVGPLSDPLPDRPRDLSLIDSRFSPPVITVE